MDTYEKKYKEALERAKDFYNDKDNIRYANAEGMLEEIFPEIKESEDEQIKEYLIRYIDNTMKSSELKSKLLAWLEKQDKTVWSEETGDDAWINDIISKAENNLQLNKAEIERLKSLKNKVQPQNTWKPSEEQMKALHDLNLTGNISYAGHGQVLIELYNDLKRLRK